MNGWASAFFASSRLVIILSIDTVWMFVEFDCFPFSSANENGCFWEACWLLYYKACLYSLSAFLLKKLYLQQILQSYFKTFEFVKLPSARIPFLTRSFARLWRMPACCGCLWCDRADAFMENGVPAAGCASGTAPAGRLWLSMSTSPRSVLNRFANWYCVPRPVPLLV